MGWEAGAVVEVEAGDPCEWRSRAAEGGWWEKEEAPVMKGRGNIK